MHDEDTPVSETFFQVLIRRYPPERFTVRWRSYTKPLSIQPSTKTPTEVAIETALFVTRIQVDLAKTDGSAPTLPPFVSISLSNDTEWVGDQATCLQRYSGGRWMFKRSYAWPRPVGEVGETVKNNLKVSVDNSGNAVALVGIFEVGGYEVFSRPFVKP